MADKWYENSNILAAIIAAIGVVLAAIVGPLIPLLFTPKKPPSSPVAEQSAIALPPSSLKSFQDIPENMATGQTVQDMVKTESVPNEKEFVSDIRPDASLVFQDNFENGLTHWTVRDYTGYNRFMVWHISSKEHRSGKSSLSLGYEDTDKKDNSDTVHIETMDSFVLNKDAKLSFSVKKDYGINLEIVLKNGESASNEKIIKFYPGNCNKEWKDEKIPLGGYAGDRKYQLLLRAWGQGSIYLDDIIIHN